MAISLMLLAMAATQSAVSPPLVKAATTATFLASNGVGEEWLTNQSIISLVRAGLGPQAILAKIGTSRSSFDTSTSALIVLKHSGVPDSVIAAMLSRSTSLQVVSRPVVNDSNPNPVAAHSPGIYLLDTGGAGRMIRIDATASNQVKTSNYWGYALTGGLSSMKKKIVVPNLVSRTPSMFRRPTFYFYFAQPGALADLTGFNSNVALSAASPNEFSLVRLEQNKDHREVAIESINIISRVKSGVADKARIPFTYAAMAPGVFRVVPAVDLASGEYGFISSVSVGTDRDIIARIFDFSIN